MARVLKVLLASFVLVGCVLALIFIIGPYIAGHEIIGKYVGGNIQWIIIGGTLLLAPFVNRWLK